MKISLKEKLLEHIRLSGTWVAIYDIERVGQELGFLGGNAGRRCRELCQDGKLRRRINGKVVEYCYVNPQVKYGWNTREGADIYETAKNIRESREINHTLC